MENQQTLIKGLENWFGESVLVKLGLIGFLTLLLLIPSNLIQDLIRERQNRQNEVIREISDKWSGSQLVNGPVMVLPYKTMISQKDADGKISYKETMTNIYILPEILNIASHADPEILHRGIFDAVVYNTRIKINGKFSALELKKSGINPEQVQWGKAKVIIGMSDLKGLKNNPAIKLDQSVYNAEPDFTSPGLFGNDLMVLPDLSTGKNTAVNFSFDLDLRGSSDLSFRHLGKSTSVTIDGKWDNPSFTGRYLPESRSISARGFTATWKMPYFSRVYPQQWIEEKTVFAADKSDSTFGVKFILPVDQYQKTMRSAKYSILVILLTFISLFFSELINKKKIHLLQYVLIGAAMTIYYTLLLSFSEQVGFNSAYLIASAATIILIGLFIATVLKNRRPAIVFAGILTVFYSFIFVIIQLQDLALLFGSIGLFIIVSVLMYLSSRMEWTKSSAHDTTPGAITN
jgi:inner membrane protein